MKPLNYDAIIMKQIEDNITELLDKTVPDHIGFVGVIINKNDPGKGALFIYPEPAKTVKLEEVKVKLIKAIESIKEDPEHTYDFPK